MWKPTVHFRMTEQAAPAKQSTLFAVAPQSSDAPQPCDHVADKFEQSPLFSGAALRTCVRCGAPMEGTNR